MNYPQQVDVAFDVLRRHFGDRILGAYLFGSAVMGGLRPRSDIDILVVVREPMDETQRQRLTNDLMKISGGTARPLEVTVVLRDDIAPWRYPPRREFQYGEWLRNDVLAGKPIAPALDPDLAVMLTMARQTSRSLLGPEAAALFEPVPAAAMTRALLDIAADVIDGWHEDERNAMLALARIWVTLSSGDIVPKDIAAQRLLGQLPHRYKSVLEQARAEYLGGHEEDWKSRVDEVYAFVEYIHQQIKALAGA